MFTHSHRIQLHETDAYSIIFFANQLKICHDAFQDLLDTVGLPLPPTRAEVPWMLVIIRAESDYQMPVHVGDLLTVSVQIAHIGTTSLQVVYTLANQDGIQVGMARTVHVCIESASSQKRPLPEELRQALTPYCS